MARIIGVEVPPNKRIDIALRYVYGIGPTNAIAVLTRANIDPSIRAKDLTEQQFLERTGELEADWRQREADAGSIVSGELGAFNAALESAGLEAIAAP